MSNKPFITVCGTTYQAARTLDLSLQSVINVLEKLGIEYEVVIVDNYSTDGTYEKLLKWSRKIPMRVYRYKCSRGLGRAICVALARGDYIFMIDLDRVYNQEALIELLKCHEVVTKVLNVQCTRLCSKDAFLKINFRDLNRAEDVDRYVRLIKSGIKYLPITTNTPLYREVRIIQYNGVITTYINTLSSEIRYVRSINEYLRRELRNALDMLVGGAYTLTKFIREDYYVWNRGKKAFMKYLLIIIRAIIIAVLLTINFLRNVKAYEASKYVSNHLYTKIHWQLMTLLSNKLLKNICPVRAISIRELINDPESIYAWSMIIHEKRRHERQVDNR